MKISFKWLGKYIDTAKLDPTDLADELTFKAIEVDEVYNLAENMIGVVVGKILEVNKHPNADNLVVCQVDIQSEKLQIVTAGTNLEVGLFVPVATVGAKLANTPVIKKAKLKGVESAGMFCRKEELGLGTSADPLQALVLPASAKVGAPIAEALDLDDIIFDVDVLANRGDLMGHRNLAREIATIKEIDFKEPAEIDLPKENKKLALEITNQAPEKCARFSALVISGVKVEEAPGWLKSRLLAVGIRPINNLVDLTNYMMFDLAHVFHAFDYDKLAGNKMNIRLAKPGEKITTLDKIERKLEKDMLIIEDAEKIIDLPGIMGGLNSAISNETKNIVLIGAADDALSIRKTSRRLGLRTDAVAVIEKGIDVEGVMNSVIEAWGLLKELIPTAVLEKKIDIYPAPVQREPITLNAGKVNSLLGSEYEAKQMSKTLESLGCEILKDKKEYLEVMPPSWRRDLKLEEDLIEEVARISGLNTLPSVPIKAELIPTKFSEKLSLLSKLKHLLADKGFVEVYNYSFMPEALAKKVFVSPESHIKVKNPLSEEQAVLRQELISGCLNNTSENAKRFEEFKIFELSKVYLPAEGNELIEGYKLAVVFYQHGKTTAVKDEPYYKARGLADYILAVLGIEDFTYQPIDPTGVACNRIFDLQKSANIFVDKMPIGTLGEISEEVKKNFDLEGRVAVLDLSFEQLVKLANFDKFFQPLAKYPSVKFDLAILVELNISWQQVLEIVQQVGGRLLQKVELFDIYQGKQIPENKKSLAFSLEYLDPTKTLKSEEVEKIQNEIIKALEKDLKVVIR